jgi:type I restriction enzyme S subunit
VFDTITQATFDTVNYVSPNSVARDAFEAAASPLLSKIKQNLIETRSLVELRDTLLPKLLSGELPVQAALNEAAHAL